MRSIFENIGVTREHHTLAQRAVEESFGSEGTGVISELRDSRSARTSSRQLVRDHPIDRATGVNSCRISMDLDQWAVGKLQQTLLLGFEHHFVLLESPGNFFE